MDPLTRKTAAVGLPNRMSAPVVSFAKLFITSGGHHMQSFTGFSDDTVRFLAELTFNNEKGWFDENRARYEAVWLEPARRCHHRPDRDPLSPGSPKTRVIHLVARRAAAPKRATASAGALSHCLEVAR